MEVTDKRLASSGHVFRALMFDLLLLLHGSRPPDWQEVGEEGVVWTRRDLFFVVRSVASQSNRPESWSLRGEEERGSFQIPAHKYDYPRNVKSNFSTRTRKLPVRVRMGNFAFSLPCACSLVSEFIAS